MINETIEKNIQLDLDRTIPFHFRIIKYIINKVKASINDSVTWHAEAQGRGDCREFLDSQVISFSSILFETYTRQPRVQLLWFV